ncbi:MAG: hypothetical protein ABR899_05040, partial [Candidatus Krumholzibacteriaceae bacterium]
MRQGGPVCTAAGDQNYVAMSPSPGGGAIIAWVDYRSNPDIYAQKIDNYGRVAWALNGVGICTEAHAQYSPSCASDGLGGAFIAWQDDRSVDTDIYVQHVDANGAALWTPEGVAVCQAAGDQVVPQVVADNLGGCIVAWIDYRVGPDETNIYAQKVKSNGSVAWTMDGVAVCTVAGNQYQLHIVPDGKGGAIMAWSDYRDGADIYAQKIRPDGSVAWATKGKGVCTAAGFQQDPDMASDGRYGAVIAWTNTYANDDIYAQRIDSLGNSLWTANGVDVSTTYYYYNYPVVAVDGEGNAVIAWIDNRSSGYDCYAQRIAPNGALKWAADGVPVCTASGSCSAVRILPIREKAVGIVWSDTRNGASDIYAQGVDSTGMSLLAPNGIAICDTTGNQASPIGVPDGSGGAIICWTDYRNGSDSDVYAARVSSNGVIVATLLQGYKAAARADGVEIDWTLSQEGAGMSFTVLRASARDRVFAGLNSRDISCDGLAFSFVDRSAEPGASYLYRVDIADENGQRTLFETNAVSMPSLPVTLYQNSPNPFNPSTTISFYVPERCRVVLEVYNLEGKMVARLCDAQLEKGTNAVRWDGRGVSGNQ